MEQGAMHVVLQDTPRLALVAPGMESQTAIKPGFAGPEANRATERRRSSKFSHTKPAMATEVSQHPPEGLPHHPRDRTGSMSVGALASAAGAAPENGGGASQDGSARMSSPVPDAATSEIERQVQEVLSSEIGISTLLNRLKQTISSAKEFAQFLKKRAAIEEDHAYGMRKLCKTTQDMMQRPDHKQGSFSDAYHSMMMIHDKMAQNELQFSSSLQQMHDDLVELAAIAEKNRKGWKVNGLAAEQKVADMEASVRKLKAKLDSTADEYERVRTGDSSQKGAKMFGFKGPKSAAQHEDDLLRKVQALDQDFRSRVDMLQAEKSELINSTRPEAVKALQDIIKECDAGLALQIQKFASFNEKLLLSNGLSISPLRKEGDIKSLRDVVTAINNENDLSNYLAGHHRQLPSRAGELKYERHSVLGGGQSMAGALAGNQGPTPQPYGQPGAQYNMPQQQFNSGPAQQQSNNSPMGGVPPMAGAQRPSSRGHERFNGPPQLGALSFQQPTMPQMQPQSQPQPHQPQPQHNMGPVNPLMQHPPQHGNGGRPGSPGYGQGGRNQSPPHGASVRPVFGSSLNRLYERDGLAVPQVVYQCITAVDFYVSYAPMSSPQGVVRRNGGLTPVAASDSPSLDFRNPENFFHDVNSVAGLLKQFFRDLQDPLLTREHYSAFIEAAKNEDDIVRRDSMHAIINNLPDPNYATLRALALHLHRVMENSHVNRMNSQNLAIVFGPTLMGTGAHSDISDAGWQVRVVDTILINTLEIFDDD
uniref:Beta-chimaerin n=1 Tax=Pyricularia oryzae (strain 70-15 / ATCC MYA-4617 / FGSC 8958) TaxID=242507 RepID=Q2KF43_PYRO7|nr:hypothetical protein MGCH7_ch7g843 [Pyricularia oryzae 70-15]